MKRYRVIQFDYDTRANILKEEIQESWAPKLKEQWEQNKIQIKEELIAQYGIFGYFEKIDNFIKLEMSPLSIIAFHNKFLGQTRNAFVIGAYYSALTSACALGERILNHLIITLREDFKSTKEYKKIYRKDSFDNWELAINTLESWKILLPDAKDLFLKLREMRNNSIHFRPETDHNDKDLALEAILCLQNIISAQFSALGAQPWFFITLGEIYIKKEWENNPFVRKVYIPNCILVGPFHIVESVTPKWRVKDYRYKSLKISENIFIKLRKKFQNNRQKLSDGDKKYLKIGNRKNS